MGDLGECAHVGDAEIGVGDDFGVDEPGGGADHGSHGVKVGDVNEVDLDTELGRQQGVEQALGAHVDDVGHDGVVAGVEEGEEGGVQGRHVGAEHGRRLAVIVRCQFRLESELVGTGLAGVDEQVRVVVEAFGGILGQQVGVGHHDGGADRSSRGVGAVPAVHRP